MMHITNSNDLEIRKIVNITDRIGNDLYSVHRNRLRMYEDEMLTIDYRRIIFLNEEKIDSNIVKSATLPFVLSNQISKQEALKRLDIFWAKKDCKLCKNGIVYRHTMPTGNLNPDFMFIGEAPGTSDGNKPLERVMGYGPTSSLLRMALLNKGILKFSWFTNIMKCAFENNKCIDERQYDACVESLFEEIEMLKPKKIIVLGNKAANYLLKYDIIFTKIIHPSFCLYKGIAWRDYAKNFIF